jgi:hypothetical protein
LKMERKSSKVKNKIVMFIFSTNKISKQKWSQFVYGHRNSFGKYCPCSEYLRFFICSCQSCDSSIYKKKRKNV